MPSLDHSSCGYPPALTESLHDRWFPEAWRVLALSGADIVVVSNASAGGSDLFQPAMRTWAAENIFFVVGVNRAGSEDVGGVRSVFYGETCVVSPRGEVMATGGRQGNQVVSAQVDLEEIRRARFDRTMFRDRRPELYRLLVEQ